MEEDHYISESRMTNRASLSPEKRDKTVPVLPTTPVTPSSTGTDTKRRKRRGSGEILQDAMSSVLRSVIGQKSPSKSEDHLRNNLLEEAKNGGENRLTSSSNGGVWRSMFGGSSRRSGGENNSSSGISRISWKRRSRTASDVEHEEIARLSQVLWSGKGIPSGCPMEVWRQHLTPLLLAQVMGLNSTQIGSANTPALQCLALFCAKESIDPMLPDYLHTVLMNSDSKEVLSVALSVTRSLPDSELCELARKESEAWRNGTSTFERCLLLKSIEVRYAACTVLVESHLPRLERMQDDLDGSIIGTFENEQDRMDAAQDLKDWIVKTWQLVADLIVPTGRMEHTEEEEILAAHALRGLLVLFRRSVDEENEEPEASGSTKSLARKRVYTYLSTRLPQLLRFAAAHSSTVLSVSSILAYAVEQPPLSTPRTQSNPLPRYVRAWLQNLLEEFCEATSVNDFDEVADAAESALLLAKLKDCEALRSDAYSMASKALLGIMNLTSTDQHRLVRRCTNLLLLVSRQTDVLGLGQRLKILERVLDVSLLQKDGSRPDLNAARKACVDVARSGASFSQLQEWLNKISIWSDASSTSHYVLAYYLLISSSLLHSPSEQVQVLEMLKDCLRVEHRRSSSRIMNGADNRWMEAFFDAYIERVDVLAASRPEVRELVLRLLAASSAISSRPSTPSSRTPRRTASEESESWKTHQLHSITRARLCVSLATTALENDALSIEDATSLFSYMTKFITPRSSSSSSNNNNNSLEVLSIYIEAATLLAKKYPRKLIDSITFTFRTVIDIYSKDSMETKLLADAQKTIILSSLYSSNPSPTETSSDSSSISLNNNNIRTMRPIGKSRRFQTRRLSGPGDLLFVVGRATRMDEEEEEKENENKHPRIRITIRVVNVSQTVTLQDVKFHISTASNNLLSTPSKDVFNRATSTKLRPDASLIFVFDLEVLDSNWNGSDFDTRSIYVSWTAKDSSEPLLQIDLPEWTLSPSLFLRSIPEFNPFDVVHPQDFRNFWERLRYSKKCKVTCVPSGGTSLVEKRSIFPHTTRLDSNISGTSSSFHATGFACRSPTNGPSVMMATCLKTSETCAIIEYRSNDRHQLNFLDDSKMCREVLNKNEEELILVDFVTMKEWPGSEEDESRFMDNWQLRKLEGWSLPKTLLGEAYEDQPQLIGGVAEVVDAAETTALHFDVAMTKWKKLQENV